MAGKDPDGACMSAPGKNSAEVGLRDTSRVKSDRLAVMVEKDAVSRFSSCTAKTSPSTDNNSAGYGLAQESWDMNLQAKIRHQSALIASAGSETPTRLRACSDTPLNAHRDESSPSGHPIENLADINISARSSHMGVLDSTRVATGSASGKPAAKMGKTRSNKATTQGRRDQNPVGPTPSPQTNDATGQRITTPYPGKYKTVMCRFYQRQEECPFGVECNYAHGKGQLKPRESNATQASKPATHAATLVKPEKSSTVKKESAVVEKSIE